MKFKKDIIRIYFKAAKKLAKESDAMRGKLDRWDFNNKCWEITANNDGANVPELSNIHAWINDYVCNAPINTIEDFLQIEKELS